MFPQSAERAKYGALAASLVPKSTLLYNCSLLGDCQKNVRHKLVDGR